MSVMRAMLENVAEKRQGLKKGCADLISERSGLVQRRPMGRISNTRVPKSVFGYIVACIVFPKMAAGWEVAEKFCKSAVVQIAFLKATPKML